MKKVITILLAVLLCFAVASCDEEKANERDLAVSEEGIFGCFVAENGIYHIEGENMYFADFETGYDVVLCNKPGCMHLPYNQETNPLPTCDSVSMHGEQLFDVVVYKGALYWVTNDFADSKLCIYKSELDGSLKRLIATEKGFYLSSISTPTVCTGDRLYYVGTDVTAVAENEGMENQRTEKLICFDLLNGETKVLFEKQNQDGVRMFMNFFADEEKLYYTIDDGEYGYEETELSNGDIISMLKLQKQKYDLYALDLMTQEQELLHSSQEEGVYVTALGLSDSQGMIFYNKYDIYDSEGKMIYEDGGFAYVAGDKLLTRKYENNDLSINVVDIPSGEIENSFKISSSNIQADTEKYIIVINMQSNKKVFWLCEKKDFYSGNVIWKEIKDM
ncbi:MAG: hypothetical protein E7491_05570 [Ruminococcaceae bacterium]|nr:hypothetical protein [Oscillospiraceae bacterium]